MLLDGGVSSAESLLLTGNPAGRREKLITTDAVTLGGLVVKTYCPENESAYKDLVSDIDATKPTADPQPKLQSSRIGAACHLRTPPVRAALQPRRKYGPPSR